MRKSKLMIAIAEDAVNRVLRLDPETLRRLGEFDGKTFCFKFETRDQNAFELFAKPFEGGMRLFGTSESAAEVTIQGNIPLLTRMLFGDAVAGLAGEADMQIRGDIALGQRLKQALDQIDIDWEEHSSRVLGDVPAHALGRFVRDARQWKSQAWHTMQLDFSEYIKEEVRLVPDENKLDRFFQAVDGLQSDIDGLLQRVQQLQQGR